MLPILTTKLFTPSPPTHFISRDRLNVRLERGVDKKISLVTAPAGFGKTTLIASWLVEQKKRSVAWLTADEYDNDLYRFLRYFLAAWQKIDQSLGENAANLLQESWAGPGQFGAESVIITLINDLTAVQTPSLFVLDDWHTIENKAIQSAIQYWIEHVPSHIHTVILSREEPNFPLSRWRVRGQMSEFSAQDLQFTEEEAAQFFSKGMKLNLSSGQLTQLMHKTEGWIASLQLAAFSLQNSQEPGKLVKEFTGSNRYLVDYLVDEVLDSQSEPIKTFLLETAVLSRLNASLCDAVHQTGVICFDYKVVEFIEQFLCFLPAILRLLNHCQHE